MLIRSSEGAIGSQRTWRWIRGPRNKVCCRSIPKTGRDHQPGSIAIFRSFRAGSTSAHRAAPASHAGRARVGDVHRRTWSDDLEHFSYRSLFRALRPQSGKTRSRADARYRRVPAGSCDRSRRDAPWAAAAAAVDPSRQERAVMFQQLPYHRHGGSPWPRWRTTENGSRAP
jgi:hypothetical protein